MARHPGPDPRRPLDDRGAAPLPPDLDPRGRRASRRDVAVPGRRRRIAVRRTTTLVRIAAAALSLVILVGSGYAWATYQKFTSNIATGDDLDSGGADLDGKDQNILLIGNDSRAGATPAELQELSTEDDGGSVNTDTMILLHVPADGSRASLISFPRDSYVDIPGYGENRINAAYSNAYNQAKSDGGDEIAAQSAGIKLTAETISQLTGLKIDHYLQVNLLGFYRISVALGGIDVCLNAAQQDPFSGIDLPAGVSRIEGKQALAFVRQRHGLPRGDLDRIARQQYFLGAVFRKVSSAGTLVNPFKLNDLVDAVSSSLLKDKSLDLLSLARQVQDLRAGNITFATIPTTGNETVDGQDVLGVDPAQVQQEVQQIIGNTADTVAKAAPVAPGSFSVDVLNGSDTGGVAQSNADLLTSAGYQVGTIGNFDGGADATQIRFPAGQAGQAKTLAKVVPGATYVQTSSVSTVTLVIGANGVGVKDPSAAASTTAAAPPPETAATSASASTRAASDISCIN
ncbi:LCP family protein [Jatrophihabitans sp. YIM 134969]